VGDVCQGVAKNSNALDAILCRQSAYFTIPDGLDHGADLYCSYRACRAEGGKFRYCATCQAPAARRNFRKRHGHGDPTPHNTRHRPPDAPRGRHHPNCGTIERTAVSFFSFSYIARVLTY